MGTRRTIDGIPMPMVCLALWREVATIVSVAGSEKPLPGKEKERPAKPCDPIVPEKEQGVSCQRKHAEDHQGTILAPTVG
jgi:hypothetical protein